VVQIEIPDDARYVLVTCIPGGSPELQAQVEYPAERGMEADDALVLLVTANNILTQQSAQERQQRANARLASPLAPPSPAPAPLRNPNGSVGTKDSILPVITTKTDP
jgi:hypothetical protein